MKKILFFCLIFFSFSLKSGHGELARINDIDIWWEGFGDKKNPPVLLIMGLNANSKYWDQEFIDEIVKNNFYVITFDNRDAGKSTWIGKEPFAMKVLQFMPSFINEYLINNMIDFMLDEEGRFRVEESEQTTAEYDLGDMALDAVGLLDYLYIEEAHVVGASLGGMVAQVLALDHPDRILTLTPLMTTPGFDTEGLPGPTKSFMDSLKKSFILNLHGEFDAAAILIETAQYGTKYSSEESVIRKKIKRIQAQGNNPYSLQTTAVGASPNRLNRLKEIKIPTLVIHGSEDPLIPLEHGLVIAEQIEGSNLMIMEGVGHELPLQYIPKITNRLVSHFNSINN